MKRCVIVSAGEIRDYEKARSFLREGDFFVFCDGGLVHAGGLCVKPDIIVGDFDSCKAASVPFIWAEYGFGKVDAGDGEGVAGSLKSFPELAKIL